MTSAQSSAKSYQSTSIITSENPDRTWAPGLCVWCAGDHGVEVFAGEPRCSECREHETVIAEARRFIGMYGLRPLGGSLDSDDEEEREYRAGARDARAALNAVRLAEQPTRDQIRRAVESGPSAVARVEAHVIAEDEDDAATVEAADTAQTAAVADAPAVSDEEPAAQADPAPRPAPRAAAPRARSTGRRTRKSSPAVTVDLATLESRVGGLLEQLDSVERRIGELSAQTGLSAQARVKDLERERTRVLGTLAALEKARRAQMN